MIADTAIKGDMVVCLGAGSITNWAQALPEQLRHILGVDLLEEQDASASSTISAPESQLVQFPSRTSPPEGGAA